MAAIEHIAHNLAMSDISLLAYEGREGRSLDELREINQRDGFSYQTSAPLGGYIQHEGVRLGEQELARVYARKEEIVTEELARKV